MSSLIPSRDATRRRRGFAPPGSAPPKPSDQLLVAVRDDLDSGWRPGLRELSAAALPVHEDDVKPGIEAAQEGMQQARALVKPVAAATSRSWLVTHGADPRAAREQGQGQGPCGRGRDAEIVDEDRGVVAATGDLGDGAKRRRDDAGRDPRASDQQSGSRGRLARVWRRRRQQRENPDPGRRLGELVPPGRDQVNVVAAGR